MRWDLAEPFKRFNECRMCWLVSYIYNFEVVKLNLEHSFSWRGIVSFKKSFVPRKQLSP